MKRIMITGGAGFIGSNLARELDKNKNNEVVVIDDLSRGKLHYLEDTDVTFGEFDLRNSEDVKDCFDFSGVPDIVYHCACRIGGMQFLHGSSEKEFLALNDNLAIDRNVFKVCRDWGVKRIVYTSSVSVYNTRRQYSCDAIFSEDDLENQKLDPEGGYGWAKYMGEKQLGLLKDTKVGIARIFKSYGPYDDYSPESGQVVLSLMRKLLKGEKFEVWGDGRAERCLLHIDDLINSLIKLSRYPKSLTVNLGGMRPISMRELAETIVLVSGIKTEIKYGTSEQNGPISREPVLSLARDKLGFYPEVNLEEGLRRTWNWLKEEIKYEE